MTECDRILIYSAFWEVSAYILCSASHSPCPRSKGLLFKMPGFILISTKVINKFLNTEKNNVIRLKRMKITRKKPFLVSITILPGPFLLPHWIRPHWNQVHYITLLSAASHPFVFPPLQMAGYASVACYPSSPTGATSPGSSLRLPSFPIPAQSGFQKQFLQEPSQCPPSCWQQYMSDFHSLD